MNAATNVASETTPADAKSEPVVSLPTMWLLIAVVGGGAITVGAWSAAIAAGPWAGEQWLPGTLGIAIVTIVALLGVLVMSPWVERPVTVWMSAWLGATVFRLLLTPLAVWLLYSALPESLAAQGWKGLAIAVALSYLIILAFESFVLAGYLRRTIG